MTQATHLLPLVQGESGASFVKGVNGWTEGTPVCNWYGITCDPKGDVTVINLAGSELSGTIPNSLGKVTTLKELILESNAFSGPVPREVARLPRLKNIDLSFNRLDGTIPKLSSSLLEVISLAHNKFTGSLDAGIGMGMDKLQIFNIQYNLVSGTIPPLTASFPALEELDFSNNLFKGTIPGFVGQLESIKRLYLSNNHIIGTIPALETASTLEEIYLHGNMLSGTLPATLADLPKLSVLFIDENKITGTVPQELCDLDLNEVFFHDSSSSGKDVDKSYSEIYGRRNIRRRLQRGADSDERDGCTSIACPAGWKSMNENKKDGVFPCEPCEDASLNPYIGSNRCFVQSEETILTKFYESTNGDDWSKGSSSWTDSSIPVCSKDGIKCNDNGRVTHIRLPDRGLTGTLPPDLGFLSHLEEFDVSDNQIRGELPGDLRFPPLKKLDISDNLLTGYVPWGLCQKAGVNGNGMDGIFTCDTIACGVGYHSPLGRAEAGATGTKCLPCRAPQGYLGSSVCSSARLFEEQAITPFGVAGELLLALMALFFLAALFWVWKRSKISSDYIQNRVQGEKVESEADGLTTDVDSHDEHHVEDSGASSSDMLDPLSGIDGVEAFSADIEVKVKDEWSSGKESTKEVWLDVPKIQ